MGEIYDRYMAGQHHDAWRELTGYSEWIKLPEYLGDAHKIAAETMARVHRNLDRLIPRLSRMGFRFGEARHGKKIKTALCKPVRRLPDNGVLSHLTDLLATTSPMPLSLHSFFATVGGVNLCGYHPHWPEEILLDPLWMPALDDSFFNMWKREFTAWRTDPDHPCHKGQLEIELSPSAQAKANRSGGQPCAMRVGLLIMDDIFINDYRPMSFIGYLREVFDCGGFPGLGRCTENHTELISTLTEGFETF